MQWPSSRAKRSFSLQLRFGKEWKWKVATIVLSGACLILIGMMQMQTMQDDLRPGAPVRYEDTGLRPETSPLDETVSTELLLDARAQLAKLEAQLTAQIAATKQTVLPEPTIQLVNYTTVQYVEKQPEKNPLQLSPLLNAQCRDPDIIQLQRWIEARQHTYQEPNDGSGADVKNPDPDPYCKNVRLVIDTHPAYYVWSEADVLAEAEEIARKAGKMPNSQRVLYPKLLLPQLRQGTRARRQSGFGIAAQIHIIAQRMIWAWKNGYTYVSVAPSLWTKGMTARTGEQVDPPPFQSDASYWSASPWASSYTHSSCASGGWDCFFQPFASLGCRQRANEIWDEAKHFPPLSSVNEMKLKEVESKWNALINPNLEEELNKPTFTSFNRVKTIQDTWKGSMEADTDRSNRDIAGRLSSLPRTFNQDVNPDAPNWTDHSANPWSLPGLSLMSEYSSSRGDLFLMSETLRFLMRPNKHMRGLLKNLLVEMKYPGVSESNGVHIRETLPRSVLAVHLKTNLDGRSQSLVGLHASHEYGLLIRRLAPVLGVGSVFISSDDQTKIDYFVHTHGEGTPTDPGIGLQVLHVPYPYFGSGPTPVEPIRASKNADRQRLAGPGAIDQARSALDALIDNEGAYHVASLYIMSLFSSGFVGTLSSHWARIVMELQRWDEGGCAPAKAGWILPKANLDTSAADSERKPSFNPIFVDMDGDTYFTGDYKSVRHTHLPPANGLFLDPTIDGRN